MGNWSAKQPGASPVRHVLRQARDHLLQRTVHQNPLTLLSPVVLRGRGITATIAALPAKQRQHRYFLHLTRQRLGYVCTLREELPAEARNVRATVARRKRHVW